MLSDNTCIKIIITLFPIIFYPLTDRDIWFISYRIRLPPPQKKTVSRVDGEGAEEVGWDLDQHRQDKVDVDVAAELGRHHADAVVDQGDHKPDNMHESYKYRSKVDTVVSSTDRGRDF